jgi:hypothetical protein
MSVTVIPSSLLYRPDACANSCTNSRWLAIGLAGELIELKCSRAQLAVFHGFQAIPI